MLHFHGIKITILLQTVHFFQSTQFTNHMFVADLYPQGVLFTFYIVPSCNNMLTACSNTSKGQAPSTDVKQILLRVHFPTWICLTLTIKNL